MAIEKALAHCYVCEHCGATRHLFRKRKTMQTCVNGHTELEMKHTGQREVAKSLARDADE